MSSESDHEKLLKFVPGKSNGSISNYSAIATHNAISNTVESTDWPGSEPMMTFKTRKNLEICVILLVIAVVLCLFSIPIIVHIKKDIEEKPSSSIVIPNLTSILITNCSNMSFANNDLFIDDDYYGYSFPDVSNKSCGKGFYELNDSCLPHCSKFNQDKPNLAIMMEVVIQWLTWFGFVTGMIVLIVCVIKYKSIFTFPSVFLVYLSISFCIVEVFVIATTVDKSHSLYCQHEDLLQSMEHPTLFCKLSGIAFHYCIVNASLFWFFHVCMIFYKLMLPFRAKKTEKYDKYFHVVLVALALILPLPAVLYTVLDPNHKYITVLFPPLMCLPNDSRIFYYSVVLVINVLTAFGVSMFIPMFWVVHKHQGIFRPRVGGLALSVAEIKLLFSLCYFAIFGICTILYFQFALQDQTKMVSDLENYFKCKYCLGVTNKTHCNQDYQQYTHTPERAVIYIVMSFLPMALLIFVVNWKKVGTFVISFGYLCSKRKAKAHTRPDRGVSSHSALSAIPETSICITKSID